ncbi:hypothetical protein JCM8097_001071 [Rhodosporidiobolus ruineniae]
MSLQASTLSSFRLADLVPLIKASRSSSSPLSLLNLPVEILRIIFLHAYPPSVPRPTAPICKHLQPLLLEVLYCDIKLVSYDSLAKLCRVTQDKPEYGALTKRLTLKIPWAQRQLGNSSKTQEQPASRSPSDKNVQALFRTLTAVESLTIEASTRIVDILLLPETAGTAFPELLDLTITSTFSGWDDPWAAWRYAALPFYRTLDSLTLNVERCEASIKPSPRASFSGPSPLNFPSLYRVSLGGPCARSASAKDFVASLDNILVLRLFDFESDASLVSLFQAIPESAPLFEVALFSGDHAYDPEIEQALLRFKLLEQLEFSGSASSASPSFYDTLRGAPSLDSLVFGPDAAASTEELSALISGPRKHPSLKHLQLDNVYGVMGTRVADVEGDPYIGPGGRWTLYPDWQIPRFNEAFSRKGLKALLLTAAGSDVEVEGDAVAAIEIDEAADDEFDWISCLEDAAEEMFAG